MSGRADGPTDDEVDRRFAELMADFDRAPDQGPDTTAGSSTADADADADTTPPPDPQPRPRGPRDYTLGVDELDESFEPPVPEPLDGVDRVSLLGWVGAGGGPVALIVLVLLWQSAPPIVWVTALAATLAGWALVLLRLPRSRDDDDDDGAVV